jgi:hypothetical protein
VGHLRPCHELVALLDQVLTLRAQLVEPVLELIGERRLLLDLRLESGQLRFEAQLATQSDLGQIVEAPGLGRVAAAAHLLGLA